MLGFDKGHLQDGVRLHPPPLGGAGRQAARGPGLREPGRPVPEARSSCEKRLPAVATIAIATAATAATTVTAAAAMAATPEAAAAATALRALLGLVDAQRAPVEVGAVHLLDGLLGLGLRAHRHEAEAARLARGPVGDDVDVRDLTDAREGLAHGVDGGRKRQIADVQTRSHVSLLSVAASSPPQKGVRANELACHPNQPRNRGSKARDGEIRHVHTLPSPSSAIRGPESRESVVAGETSVSNPRIAEGGGDARHWEAALRPGGERQEDRRIRGFF